MCIEICKGSPETELQADRRACNQASNPLLFGELHRRCAERRRWTEAAIVYEHWSTWMTQPVSTLARINSRGYHLRRKPALTAHSIKETNFHIRKKSVLSLTFPDFWPPQSILLLSPDKIAPLSTSPACSTYIPTLSQPHFFFSPPSILSDFSALWVSSAGGPQTFPWSITRSCSDLQGTRAAYTHTGHTGG